MKSEVQFVKYLRKMGEIPSIIILISGRINQTELMRN